MENREHAMKPSEDQHSVSESGVAGGFCPHSQENKEPPQVCFEQKNAGDLPKSTETWSDDHLPIDIILLTVERCDLLSCFSLLDKPFKSYKKEIGYVYFGGMGDTSDQEKLKIALVKCCKGAATPGGSLTAVLNAVRVLRPKAAFSVGTCISLGLQNVKMGDVVISCKLTAEGFRTPVSPLLSRLIQDAPYGWVAPLQNPDEMEVEVHCDGDILSQSLRENCGCDDVFERYPGAVAIETGGEGLYAAAYDANIEWLIVKGVASYFHQSQSVTSEWMSFASTMAASMVAKLLKDPTVFREWPHYNQGVQYGTSEDQHSLRWNGDKIIKLLIHAAKLSKEQQEKAEKMLNQLAQSYEECHDVSTDNGVEALEAFTEYLISAYGVVLIAVGRGSVIIILECIALESLERVWNDYVSGRLDEVAEGYLVTDKMKKELKLETNCLKTTIHKENYLNCKKALMELPSTYSDAAHVEREKKASNEDRAESSNNPIASKQSALHPSSYQVIMAEARINPNRLGGFDDEFVDKVDDDLICTICRLPVKEAVQAWPCGHRFCYICIDSFIARQGTAGQPIFCPIDRTRVNKEQGIFEDIAADRKICSYTIKCPNSSRSCQWRGELRAKENHLATCPHEIVPCTNKNCNVKLERKRLRDHELTKCDWRTLQCNFCPVSQPALRMRGHHKVCPKVPVTCPLKCGMTILREKVADHKENQCELVEISCPYSKLGCREKFQRKEKTSHLQSCMQVHLDLACVKLTDTEEELQTIREKLEQTISALENRPGPYVYTWKIGGFEEILRQAKTGSKDRIESDPFYTGECGYKFKMRLYPNGRYSGENTHLSLFLINMEGEYDAILQWPCAKDVKLTLIDQQRNLDDRQTISFFFSSLGVWKSRPVKKQEVVWGRRTFVSHDELQKRAYIVDDTIFIQAKFE